MAGVFSALGSMPSSWFWVDYGLKRLVDGQFAHLRVRAFLTSHISQAMHHLYIHPSSWKGEMAPTSRGSSKFLTGLGDIETGSWDFCSQCSKTMCCSF